MSVFAHYYVISIPIQIICAILAYFIGFPLIFQVYSLSKKNFSKPLRNLIFLCSIACMLTLTIDIIRMFYSMMSNTDLFAGLTDNIFCISDFMYHSATISFYSIAFMRLHLTFSRTVFRIPHIFYVFIIASLAISCCLSVYYVTIVAIETGLSFFSLYATPAVIILAINDCFLNTILMALFVYALRFVLFGNVFYFALCMSVAYV